METRLSPPVKYFTDRSKAELLLWIICVIYVLCFSCFRVRLFIAALWSPAGKGLTSWLLFMMLNFVFVTFQSGKWGSVVLIVSIPDLCHLSYFKLSFHSVLDDLVPTKEIRLKLRPESWVNSE